MSAKTLIVSTQVKDVLLTVPGFEVDESYCGISRIQRVDLYGDLPVYWDPMLVADKVLVTYSVDGEPSSAEVDRLRALATGPSGENWIPLAVVR